MRVGQGEKDAEGLKGWREDNGKGRWGGWTGRRGGGNGWGNGENEMGKGAMGRGRCGGGQ